jgi:hypothetical protein
MVEKTYLLKPEAPCDIHFLYRVYTSSRAGEQQLFGMDDKW